MSLQDVAQARQDMHWEKVLCRLQYIIVKKHVVHTDLLLQGKVVQHQMDHIVQCIPLPLGRYSAFASIPGG